MSSCPHCNAPRESGAKCPRCGAIYAKAELLRAAAIAPSPLAAPAEVIAAATPELPPLISQRASPHVYDDEEPDDHQPALEWKLRAAAIPIAIGLAIAFHASPSGHMLQRTVFSMMVHEVGHTVTAWWSGFTAFPMPWRTSIAMDRGATAAVLVAALSAYLIVRGLRGRRWLIGLGVGLLVVQAIATLGISADTAQAMITFGGDGGAMVLGTALMISMFAGRDTQLYRGWLRWGFLVIGSAAFVDTFATWWTARTDPSVIPFGEFEDGLLSDPSKLDEVYGWTTHQIVHRYVTLGVICLVVLVAAYAWGVWSARRDALASGAR